jgi:hypothetical protein
VSSVVADSNWSVATPTAIRITSTFDGANLGVANLGSLGLSYMQGPRSTGPPDESRSDMLREAALRWDPTAYGRPIDDEGHLREGQLKEGPLKAVCFRNGPGAIWVPQSVCGLEIAWDWIGWGNFPGFQLGVAGSGASV